MVIDIKMCRFENVPWGFRLVGGADFEFPLTVVKVNEGSIAEEAGMREGDVIVRINDTATSPLSHDEADKVIRHCGNVFYIGVQREGEDELVPKMFPVLGLERPPTPQDFLDVSGRKSPLPRQLEDSAESPTEYLSDLPERPSSVLSEQTEIKLVEEEIAAVLSGESEVLKEHNVIGIFPKPGVCMTSDVLRTLNADATKTKAEKDKENKKWSTFLVKPDRPVPKSKEQIEAERRAANAYKVKIVVSRSRSPSPMPQPPKAIHPVETKPSAVIEKQPSPPKVEEVEEPPPKDSELPNLEEVKIVVEPPAEVENQLKTMEDSIVESKQEVQETKSELSPPNETTATPPSAVEQSAEESATTNGKTTNASAEPNVPELQQREKTEEELALERQLADVQRQLAALSSLPSTIQATLDSVTKQLATLLPAFQLQTVTTQPQRLDTSVAAETRSISLEKIEEITEVTKTQEAPNPDSTCTKNDIVTTEPVTVEAKENADTEVSALDDVKKQEARQNKEDMQIREEEQNAKKQKRNDVIEELEEQLERKNNPRRSKRAFGPLTPSSERPLVLPGGRRWYRPKDAYNDEFIAETLSAQAELITGTTLGVNFMKYQKPEKKIDLNRSEVYKVIHHLDRQPVRGIEVRPPVVPAEVDIRKVALQP
ncbi:fibrous sheath CABYR-binding protein isoform X2 [Anastrepha ludens]|uniref:fibrous sheath CABYR-binding protein isoform X2 n=1 Tax=Anastrepha ludens TaxID=28586 RepID=UPI0023AF0A24|nr:fibrous sheath CABYR-binding protein isoform X2 [Anastrepha ludens]